jgi:hypothetical protein
VPGRGVARSPQVTTSGRLLEPHRVTQAARNLLYQSIKSLKKLLTALTFVCFVF